MDIYSILASKSHNSRYLNRYINFIRKCQHKNIDYAGHTEKHHICPKAKDMFPEYKDFLQHEWNKSLLTVRQHFIAHVILIKVYPTISSQKLALERMYYSKQNGGKLTSKQLEILKLDNLSERRISHEMNKRKLEDGTHHFLIPGMRTRINETRVKNGTHHFVGGYIQKQSCINRAEDGSHPWLGGKVASKTNKRKIKEGTHNWLQPDYQSNLAKKRIESGTHNFDGIVNCVDRQGNKVKVKKEIYRSQNKDDMEYAFHRSFEAKRRINFAQVQS